MVVIMFPKKYEPNITRALDSVTHLLIRYFTGIVAESSIMTLIVSLGLLMLGFSVHNALVIGLIVGVLNVIPYLGPWIGAAAGIFIGVAGTAGGDVSTAGLAMRVAGTILVAQGIDNFVLQPVLYSNRAKAHPLEIFLVILIAGSLAGVLGMLLAIPAYNVIRVFAKEFFNNFRVVQKLTEKIQRSPGKFRTFGYRSSLRAVRFRPDAPRQPFPACGSGLYLTNEENNEKTACSCMGPARSGTDLFQGEAALGAGQQHGAPARMRRQSLGLGFAVEESHGHDLMGRSQICDSGRRRRQLVAEGGDSCRRRALYDPYQRRRACRARERNGRCNQILLRDCA